MKTISFFALGEPKGQPRPRAFVFRGRARVYNPAQAEHWKTAIAQAAEPHIPTTPFEGPVCLELTFYFPRPKQHYRTGQHAGELKYNAPTYHIQKPDRDNSDKAVMDCLTILGFWRDDSQVCDGYVKKLWCPAGLRPGAQICITALDEPGTAEAAKQADQRELRIL